jgi:RND family efflux transporter MFP subunit
MNSRTPHRIVAAVWFAAAVATLTLTATVAGCGGAGARHDTASKAPDEVLLSSRDLAPVLRTDLAAGVPLQGTLQPSVDVRIVTPYPELIEAVLVKEGQAVRRGQVLARLRVAAWAPAAASAESQRRVAAAEYERMRNLFREGAVAQRDVDVAEAQLRAAEAAAAVAGKQLEDASVTAPDDGVIATRFVQGGDRVGEGDPLFRLVNTSELEFAASVPTEALDRIKPGVPVALVVSGLEDRTVSGRIARVNATVDAATRQVKVYVNVPNRDRRLAGDMFASGRILFDVVKGATAVPGAALRTSPDGSVFVWVVNGGALEKRPVAAGLRDEMRDLVEVKSGLREGERVVVSPIEGLVPGQAVRVAGDSTMAGAASGAATAAPAGGGR